MAKWWIGAVFSLIIGSFLIGVWAGLNTHDNWMLGVGFTLIVIGLMLLWTARREEVEQAYDRGLEGQQHSNLAASVAVPYQGQDVCCQRSVG